jgi:hypothetical protein
MRAGQCYRILVDAAKFIDDSLDLECHAGPVASFLLGVVHVVE